MVDVSAAQTRPAGNKATRGGPVVRRVLATHHPFVRAQVCRTNAGVVDRAPGLVSVARARRRSVRVDLAVAGVAAARHVGGVGGRLREGRQAVVQGRANATCT